MLFHSPIIFVKITYHLSYVQWSNLRTFSGKCHINITLSHEIVHVHEMQGVTCSFFIKLPHRVRLVHHRVIVIINIVLRSTVFTCPPLVHWIHLHCDVLLRCIFWWWKNKRLCIQIYYHNQSMITFIVRNCTLWVPVRT